jgi:hypothetical protein
VSFSYNLSTFDKLEGNRRVVEGQQERGVSWPKPIVTLLRADPARKIPEKIHMLRPPSWRSWLPYVAHLSKSAFGELKRQHRGAALEWAIAEWIAEHDR